MDEPVDPMSELENLYDRYVKYVELGKTSLRVAEYWAPAPPPLTLAASS